MTKNAVFLKEKRVKHLLFFVRKDSRGLEAPTGGPGYYTVAATFEHGCNKQLKFSICETS